MAIFSLRTAASFKNQAFYIYKAAVHYGFECEDKDLAERMNFPKERWDRVIVLAPLWPRYIFDSVRLAAPWVAGSFTLYGPVDGPYTQNVQIEQVLKNLQVVTTSRFCYDCMTRSGVNVRGVVYHGIDHSEFEFEDLPRYDRPRKLREQHPGKTIYFSNVNPLHRKGLPHLAEALKVLSEKRRGEWIFYLHTGRGKALKLCPDLEKIPDLVIEDAYNTLPFRQIALKTLACDHFVWPSLLEGFGLPVLEAAAAGRSIICLDVEPMNEIVGPSEAWLFPSKGIREERWEGPGCLAQLHEYESLSLAEAMMEAMDHPKESREKGLKAYERSKEFDYRKVYEPLVKGEV